MAAHPVRQILRRRARAREDQGALHARKEATRAFRQTPPRIVRALRLRSQPRHQSPRDCRTRSEPDSANLRHGDCRSEHDRDFEHPQFRRRAAAVSRQAHICRWPTGKLESVNHPADHPRDFVLRSPDRMALAASHEGQTFRTSGQ